jgi:hypothetical protein
VGPGAGRGAAAALAAATPGGPMTAKLPSGEEGVSDHISI